MWIIKLFYFQLFHCCTSNKVFFFSFQKSLICYSTELQKLQTVQNTAARLICNMNKFDHITPILVKLHWLPVRYRKNFKILLITFKVIRGLATKYLSELLTCKTKCIYNLRSTSEILLQQPRIKTLCTLGDRSFTVAAPAL